MAGPTRQHPILPCPGTAHTRATAGPLPAAAACRSGQAPPPPPRRVASSQTGPPPPPPSLPPLPCRFKSTLCHHRFLFSPISPFFPFRAMRTSSPPLSSCLKPATGIEATIVGIEQDHRCQTPSQVSAALGLLPTILSYPSSSSTTSGAAGPHWQPPKPPPPLERRRRQPSPVSPPSP
jgi:hypothetical protein